MLVQYMSAGSVVRVLDYMPACVVSSVETNNRII